MTFNLRENEAEILAIWQEKHELTHFWYRLSRRAWLVTESARGVDTKDLAKAVAMPEQRVIEVIDRYKQSGVLGLIENPRVGRARKIPYGAVKNLLLDTAYKKEGEFEIGDISKKLSQDHGKKISKDLIWRQTRADGITLKRNAIKNIQIEPDEAISDLAGLVITEEVTIVAVAKIKKRLFQEGCLEVPNSSLLKVLKKNKNSTILSSLKAMAKYGVYEIKRRSKKEAMLRWAQSLSKVGHREGVSIQMEICGDYKSSEMMEWLKVLKANGLDCAEDITVRFTLKEDLISLGNKDLLSAIKQFKKTSSEYLWVKRLIV